MVIYFHLLKLLSISGLVDFPINQLHLSIYAYLVSDNINVHLGEPLFNFCR